KIHHFESDVGSIVLTDMSCLVFSCAPRSCELTSVFLNYRVIQMPGKAPTSARSVGVAPSITRRSAVTIDRAKRRRAVVASAMGGRGVMSCRNARDLDLLSASHSAVWLALSMWDRTALIPIEGNTYRLPTHAAVGLTVIPRDGLSH
ncbi:hypothetical protein KUCAC02_032644, partial [Chaenocephalus aceratus]